MSSSDIQWLRFGIAGLVAAQSMVLGLAINLSPPQGLARTVTHTLLGFGAVVVFALVGGPVCREAWAQARARRFGMEQLFLIGILGAFFASLVTTFTGQGSVYYEVVTILLAIYTFGRIIGDNRRAAAWEAAKTLEKEFSQCDRLTAEGRIERVAVAVVQPGDRFRVTPGEGISLDGRVVRGVAFVRQTPLTGEAFPVVKRPGDKVWAGSHVLDSALEIESDTDGTQRQLDRLLQSVADARQRPTHWQAEADRLVGWFLPTILLLALGTFAFWTHHSGWAAGLFNGLAVILVACPCALGLATPIAIWSALNSLATRGIVAASGDFIEKLAAVDTVVFDKTGTLSDEELHLVDFITAPGLDRAQLQKEIGAVQSQSRHPLARAFYGWAGTDSLAIEKLETLPGIGVTALIDHHTLAIGNASLLHAEDEPIARDLRAALLTGTPRRASHEVFIQRDGTLVALALLQEKLRETTQVTLERLASIGVAQEVMTGDRAESVAHLGLPPSRTGLSAEQKAELVADLQRAGRRVLFVGDGINDSPAMAQAHASIALAAGAGLAREAAGAQLYGNDLTAVPAALVMARRVRDALRGNILFAITYNLIGVALCLAGLLHPILAAILMLFSSISVTWRALRLEQLLRSLNERDATEAWEELSRGSVTLHPAALTPDLDLSCSRSRWLRRAQAAWPGLFGNKDSQQLTAWFFAISLIAQGPLIAYLAQLSLSTTITLTVAATLAGVLTLRFWSRWQSLNGQMTLAMLSAGSLGMLLGWWIDAGMQPIVAAASHSCCHTASGPWWQPLAPWTGMNLGMILASLPAMVLVRDRQIPLLDSLRNRWIHALWGTVGMWLGMALSGYVMAWFPKLEPQPQFFLSFAAMTLGMLLGMFAACALWRFLVLRHTLRTFSSGVSVAESSVTLVPSIKRGTPQGRGV